MARRARQQYGLKAARKRAGLTQQALSAKAGIAQGLISKLETGRINHPRFTTVIALARALQVDPDVLSFHAA
jgi:transcriptional regulator with XRE-family HTH domain